jgi:hypothetical protein
LRRGYVTTTPSNAPTKDTNVHIWGHPTNE